MSLKGKKIALGVTGGIAAYKACEVVSLLKKAGAEVFVVMTKNACQFITPLSLETLSNNRVIVDMFDRNFEREVEHISLADKADVFLIAPATANFIAKFAVGLADDFLSTTVMAAKCPIVIAPAMNTNMLNSEAVQHNIGVLKNRGVKFIDTLSGMLACGVIGDGKLNTPKAIVEYVENILTKKKDYSGKTVLITSGGTREAIDPVRFITNHSSGKMGASLAEAAYDRGAKIVFITSNSSYRPKCQYEEIIADTTMQMYDAVMQNLERVDIVIKAAAPSDYRVQNYVNQKIKSSELNLQLVKNPDIAQEVGKIKGDKKLVVFAAETQDLIRNAQEKLSRKNADMVVANDITALGAGFNADTNIVTLITRNSVEAQHIMSKREVADKILDKLTEL